MRRDVEALLKYKFVKNVVQDLTSGGIDWQREKWQSGLGSKFIHQGEKNAVNPMQTTSLTITQDDPFVFLFIIYCNPTNPTVSTRKSTC